MLPFLSFCNMKNIVRVIEIKALSIIPVVRVSNIHCSGSLPNDLCLYVALRALAENSNTTGNSLSLCQRLYCSNFPLLRSPGVKTT